jgi:peptide/nickel transport system ATP-binding protein
VSLSVRRGETFALVGESGSGKTTLSRILLGLDAPTSGTVAIDGRDLTALPRRERGRLVQPVFQDPYSSLNPRRTVGSIIARPLVIHDIGDAAARAARVREVMGQVGLPEAFVHNYPNQLSGGQRQRVAIARALATEPGILVCDEPTSALDVSVQAQILNLLTDLRARLGLTLFLITHDIAVVHQMADRVAVMKDGRIVELDRADRVLEAPETPYTRALLEAVPRLDGPAAAEPAEG